MKLLNSFQFKNVFRKPFYRVEISKITVFSCLNFLIVPRLGISIARKQIKLSHERIRIKRLVRETFRMSQHKLVKMDFVVVVKKEVMFLKNDLLNKILRNLWYRHYQ
ncbi:ribonuclease P protein component [Buchnera aphidicola (Mindarus keteleerifoliae)]|uniref:ribonuclease P protein component n=1 Tax=Buchnera aphidicola TaxID=9 RepID=UPI0031B67242